MVEYKGKERFPVVPAVADDIGFFDGLRVYLAVEVDKTFLRVRSRVGKEGLGERRRGMDVDRWRLKLLFFRFHLNREIGLS